MKVSVCTTWHIDASYYVGLNRQLGYKVWQEDLEYWVRVLEYPMYWRSADMKYKSFGNIVKIFDFTKKE